MKYDAPVSDEALYRRRVRLRVEKFWIVLKAAVAATNSCQFANHPADCGRTKRSKLGHILSTAKEELT